MCFPPFCEPARRFLGCLSLRTGAVVVLGFDMLYGLTLVIVHALLLGDAEPESTKPKENDGERMLEGNDGSAAAKLHGHEVSWIVQLFDLDIGWGHELLGFDDYSCLVSGLLYGILVVCLCLFMINSVHTGGSKLPTTSRWFVAFMNLEIVVFVGIALAKLPKLCKIQQQYMPKLAMDCELLRFLYLQRIFIMSMVAGFGCWVFSSLAYFLSFGFQTIDRPEYAQHLEMHEAQAQVTQHDVDPSYAPMTQHHLAAASPASFSRMALSPASFSRRPVGEAVQVGPSKGTGSLLPGRTSYNIARASTSQATTATSSSHMEVHPFIKQPLALF